MIAVECVESAVGEEDLRCALAALDREPGVWLGCDVDAPGLFRREAKVALDAWLCLYLDGCVLRIVPQGDMGRALAERLARLAEFQNVQGRLELRFGSAPGQPHPLIALLRSVLADFDCRSPAFGLYGALAFDYYRLAQGDTLPDDGRRRLALMLPARVLLSGDEGVRQVDFRLPGLVPQPGTQAAISVGPVVLGVR